MFCGVQPSAFIPHVDYEQYVLDVHVATAVDITITRAESELGDDEKQVIDIGCAIPGRIGRTLAIIRNAVAIDVL